MADKVLFFIIFVIIAFSFSYRQYAVNPRDAYLLRAGLVCTLVADYCMLILYNNTMGLVFFICVQSIYVFRHTSQVKVFNPLLMLSGIYAALSYLTPLTFETRLAAVYACALIAGVLSAIICRKSYPFPNNVFILVGMLMFLMCDVNVALMNILTGEMGQTVSRILIWAFYLPSQALLSVSGAKITRRVTNDRNRSYS